jgi:hypothetical protein
MSDRPPKKSETIEIRLDHDTKSALQRRARVEGRSVSQILRDLIARYLDAPSVSATRSILMRFSIAAAVAAVLSLTAISLTTPAQAADLTLGVRGMIDLGGAPPPFEQPESSVALDFGQSAVFCVPRDTNTPITLTPGDGSEPCAGYSVLIWAQAGDADHVILGTRLLLQPSDRTALNGMLIPVRFGESGEVLTTGNDMPAAVRVMFFVDRP